MQRTLLKCKSEYLTSIMFFSPQHGSYLLVKYYVLSLSFKLTSCKETFASKNFISDQKCQPCQHFQLETWGNWAVFLTFWLSISIGVHYDAEIPWSPMEPAWVSCPLALMADCSLGFKRATSFIYIFTTGLGGDKNMVSLNGKRDMVTPLLWPWQQFYDVDEAAFLPLSVSSYL